MAGVTTTQTVVWADEMRVGLRGTVRRVWGQRGTKVVQALQFTYEWRYLFLAVDVRRGHLWWTWLARLDWLAVGTASGGLRQHVGVDALLWDRAPAHQALTGDPIGLTLVEQPPYAPELNPAERVFQELRRAVEGRVYPDLDAKVAAVTAALTALEVDPDRVRRLVGWAWLTEAMDRSPAANAA